MQFKLSRGLLSGLALALGLALVAPSAAEAQKKVTFGVEGAWSDDYDIGAGVFAKFHLTELSGKEITGRAGFDYFFPSGGAGYDIHYWEANFDGLYDLVSKSNLKPYIGAGVGYSHWSFDYPSDNDYCDIYGSDACSSSDFGFNLIGGANVGGSKMGLFFEGKLILRSGGGIQLKAGIHF